MDLRVKQQRIYKDRDWLAQSYLIMEKSARQIAKETGYGRSTICRWLKKLEIPLRSREESIHIAEGNHVELSSNLLDIIEGELLGDGCLQPNGHWSAKYQHGTKHREYLLWLQAELGTVGILLTGKSSKIYKYNKVAPDGKSHIGYSFTSKSYSELYPLYHRWYPGGKKIVPCDLVFTPVKVRQWYLGDGCLLHPKSGRPWVHIAVGGFVKHDQALLREKLAEIGIKASVARADYLYVSKDSTPVFLDYIGPCPSCIKSIYGYKWHLNKE